MGEGSGDGACGLGEVERRGDAGWERLSRLLESGLLDGVGGTGENLVDNGTGEG